VCYDNGGHIEFFGEFVNEFVYDYGCLWIEA
jgi:hypothetical protein